MKKKLYLLLTVISVFLFSACIFIGCNESVSTPSGIETPADKPGDEPEEPGESDEPEDGENGVSVFQGNPPSRPNKEDRYDAN